MQGALGAGMKRGTLSLALRAAATLGAFAALAALYDFEQLGPRLAGIGAPAFAFAVALLSACVAGMALKWNLSLPGARYRVLLRAVIASFFYSILPSGQLGGELSKILLVKARQPELADVTSSVIFDKVTGLFGLTLIGTVALTLAGNTPPWQWLVVGGIALACATALAAAARVASLLRGHLIRSARARTVVEAVARLVEDIARFASDPGLIGRSSVMAVLTQGCVVAIYMVLAIALGIPAHPAELVAAVVLANLASLIPVSLAGLGVREAGLTVLLSQYSAVAPDQALALSLSAMAVLLVAALAGGAMELRQLATMALHQPH